MVRPQDEDTDELLRRVVDGDRSALNRIFARYRNYVRLVVDMRMEEALRVRLDPSDVVQETQMEASRRIADFLERRPMTFRLWLRATAIEQLVRLQRRHLKADKRAISRETPLADNSSLLLARQLVEGRASEIVRQREMGTQVQAAVVSLGACDREILMLRHVEELTNAEVAALLKIEPVAASKRHGRALHRLHQKLIDLGITGVP